MIEAVENLVQTVALAGCIGIAGFRLAAHKSRLWMLLMLFYISMFLGDLYWALSLLLLHRPPLFDYVSEISWFSAYLFLYLLIRETLDRENKKVKSPVLWAGPVFVACMAVFYMQWGSVLSNITYAIAMGLIFYYISSGLFLLKDVSTRQCRRKILFLAVNTFCLIEYLLWTSSCIWSGDTLANPYYWIDFVQSVCLVFLLRATNEAVKEVSDE